MPFERHQRQLYPFACAGMNLSLPVDKLPPNKYRLLFNVRPYGDGQIWGRQGIQQVAGDELTGAGVIHTIRRMDDPVPPPSDFPDAFEDHLRVVGRGEFLHGAKWSDPDPPLWFTFGEAGFSGNPMSSAVFRPDQSPRPWMVVADSNKIRKVNSNGQIFRFGVAPPNFSPTATFLGARENGPDIGETGLPYRYRFTARLDSRLNTGATSSGGPVMLESDGMSPTSAADTTGLPNPAPPSSIDVQVPVAHPDPQVTNLDVYRFGGSLPEWIYIGTIGNFVGSGMMDYFSDSDIASNPRLQTAPDDINYQPFTTIDSSAKGQCSISGQTVTRTSGDLFKYWDLDLPFWPVGTQIVVNSHAFTLRRSPTDANTLEVLEDTGPLSGGVDLAFLVFNPELIHQPLPFIWGPFGAGETGVFFFACGDPIMPGALYWTEGNNPESHPSANSLDITNPSERLQNGCMYDGKAFVFSTERMWGIYPSFGTASQFSAVEVPGCKGLFARWAICSDGPAIFFLSRDGIYASSGGPPVCISDDISFLFQTESDINLPNALEGISPETFSAPDFTEETHLRLSYADGYLYFDYIDVLDTYHTLVYDVDPMAHGRPAQNVGWVSRDTYNPEIALHHQEQAADVHDVLMGSTTGRLYTYGTYADNGNTISGLVRTGARDSGDARARFHWGDVWLDFDSDCAEILWQIGFDNYTFFSDELSAGLNRTGRDQAIGDINSGTGQYARNVGLDIEWVVDDGQPKLFQWEPSFLVKPEVTILRATDWTDDGYLGDKFIQGCIIQADTLGAERTVKIQSDGAFDAITLSITHLGEQEKPYSWTPFISHQVRALPTDLNSWRLMNVRWVWEPAPELTEIWETQETTYDLQGFLHHRDAYIACRSMAPVTWTITVDGVAYTYTVPSTGGAYRKQYLVLQPMKGKYIKHRLDSPSGFRLFLKDCEVRVKAWGDPGPFQVRMPFGDFSRQVGARI